MYGGHAVAMAAPFYIFSSQLIVSGVWGVLAIAYLLLALRITDHVLGQSALLIGCIATATVPDGWGPWFAFLLIALTIGYWYFQRESKSLNIILIWLLVVIFTENYLRLVFDLRLFGNYELSAVPGQQWLHNSLCASTLLDLLLKPSVTRSTGFIGVSIVFDLRWSWGRNGYSLLHLY